MAGGVAIVTAFVLFGAGGHAKLLAEVLRGQGGTIAAYCDPLPASWIGDVNHLADDDAATPDLGGAVLGLGAVTPDRLKARLDFASSLQGRGFRLVTVRHDDATVSASATVDDGVQILAKAVIQPAAKIGAAVILNTASIVEHDALVEDGAHIAPGAIILGGARVGRCAMVGSGAIVLPGAVVAAESLVPAGSVHRA